MDSLDEKRVGQIGVLKTLLLEQIEREDRDAPLYEQVRRNLEAAVQQLEYAAQAYRAE